MAVVHLPSTLSSRAGGAGRLELEAASAGELIRRLEQLHPELRGWVLDEQGRLRQHVTLFVNDERADLAAPLAAADQLYIVQAISGGAVAEPSPGEGPQLPDLDLAVDPLELLVGTKKGLIVLRGKRGGPMAVVARQFAGQVVEFATYDPRTGTYFAAVTHGQFGPRLFYADDPEAEEWQQADGPAFPEDAGASVARIWVVEPGEEEGEVWAGVAPAALFKSEDGGRSWRLNRPLWEVPGRPEWEGGAGGLCLHSIATWPGDPTRLALGISAAGVWRTEDGGASWQWGVAGLVPRYLPEEARADTTTYCVHNLRRAPLRPERLYMQFHGGVYRSDDAGASWLEVGGVGTPGGLPADFGFPIEIDPVDPDRAFVIPLVADVDRVTPEGRVRVYETRDAGASWRSRSRGLPDSDSYLTVLRQAFCRDAGDPVGLYFGAESGEVFASADAGASWAVAADHLPPVTSVRCGK